MFGEFSVPNKLKWQTSQRGKFTLRCKELPPAFWRKVPGRTRDDIEKRIWQMTERRGRERGREKKRWAKKPDRKVDTAWDVS
ncbi:hypothetical protein TNCV_4517831 [Trichonephila clavipes]|nr:hypothetical protein TNCV_4517831 [Trichonephila clavipes]